MPYNEADTRVLLIEPKLQAAGWRGTQVTREHTTTVTAPTPPGASTCAATVPDAASRAAWTICCVTLTLFPFPERLTNASSTATCVGAAGRGDTGAGVSRGIVEGVVMAQALPQDRMSEAEVSLRLAFHLLYLPDSQGAAEVAIDGAQIRVHGDEIFPIGDFLSEMGWKQAEQRGKNRWQGVYEKDDKWLKIHARSGVGDVVVKVGDKRIRAECKGGPLGKRKGNPEYAILQRALGQIITVEQVDANDLLVVAVPSTCRFRRLADKWQDAPLVSCSGIQIVLVGRDGVVEGLDERFGGKS